ncbi:MAG: DUF1653 domain-containing protein [Alphaproteobacteria bacterium]
MTEFNPFRTRHYKGGVYEVLVEAKLEATQQSVYVYRSVATGEVWARPVREFEDTVVWNGQQVKRFTEIS